MKNAREVDAFENPGWIGAHLSELVTCAAQAFMTLPS